MRPWFRLVGIAAVIAALAAIAIGSGPAAAAPQSANAASAPDISHACAAPLPGYSSCGAIQLLNPAQNWHGVAHPVKGAPNLTTTSPVGGFYPGDLQRAYGLTSAGPPSASAPTIAIVDAYDDPNAAADLSAYRSYMNGASDPNTKLPGISIPPLCASGQVSSASNPCVVFTKYDQNGNSNYPRADKGWASEISLDMDMASAVCPNCNIDLVEASSNSNANLQTAVETAKKLANVVVVTNSYGGSESSGESSYDSAYTNTSSTAITASSGDSGYGVEYPAASPNLTAVGGTSLTYNADGSWTRSAWSGAGAGCSAYESQPYWQNLFSKPSVCSMRQVSDIAAVADPNTGVAVYDSYGPVYGISGWMVFGGTSVSAQIIGGIYGLAAFNGNEQPSPSGIYNNYSGNVLPVAAGSDGSCGSTYLCDATQSFNGYNGPTGLGVPKGIGAFTGSAPAPTSSFTVSASPTSISMTAGTATSESYTVTLTSNNQYTGTVKLSTSGCPSSCTFTSGSGSFANNSVSLSSGSSVDVTMTVATGGLSPGSYPIGITGSDGTNTSSANVTLDVTSSGSGSGGTVSTLGVLVGTITQNGHGPYHVPITVTALDSSGVPVSGASVTLNIYNSTATAAGQTCQASGSSLASGTATTGTNGQASFQFTTKKTGPYCAVATSGSATGSSTFLVP